MPISRSDVTPSADDLAPFVEMALAAIQREYPYHVTMVLSGDDDLALPREATPSFRGAFDWHSAVHGHWTLVRGLRLHPRGAWATKARIALAKSLAEPHLAAEEAFMRRPGHEGFERPYGLAWVLQLAAELRGWDDDGARHWAALLAPLETLASSRLLGWLERLPAPVRSGEHSQSAFALGLFFDWARDTGRGDLAARIGERAIRLYGADREAPVRYEPSAQDFLSPILGEADLLRRVLPEGGFTPWFERLLPAADSRDLARWLTPAVPPDRADGKFAHLDGLNLSRAWMLDGVLGTLGGKHALSPVLESAMATHRDAGIAGALTSHYMGTHWLGSFAMYLVTRRGMGA